MSDAGTWNTDTLAPRSVAPSGALAVLWRGRRLIAAVVVAVLAATCIALLLARPTYTARAALSTASAPVPEEIPLPTTSDDALLAGTYAAYFSTPQFQQSVRSRLDLPADVTSFDVVADGATPLLFVDATADSPDSARTAAATLATSFVAQVGQLVDDDHARKLAAIQAGRGDGLRPGDPAAVEAADRLQAQIDAINSDTSGRLAMVQPDAGVTTNLPSVATSLLTALLGGLLLGCTAVLLHAHLVRRMSTADDVRDRTGLPTAVVDRGAAVTWDGTTDLAALVGPGASTIAVTAVSDRPVETVATMLARQLIARGRRPVVIRMNLREVVAGHTRNLPGAADYLRADEPVDLDGLILEEGGLRVIDAGTPGEDPFALVSRERFTRLLDDAGELADVVVVESPPVGCPEAEIVNGMADRTLLVLEGERVEAGEARAAVRRLGTAGADVAGAVLVGARPFDLRVARWRAWRMRALLTAAALVVIAASVLAAPVLPGGIGATAVLAAVGVGAVFLGLKDPRWAYVILLTTLFLRIALPRVLPLDPFLIAFGGLVLSTAIWMIADRARRPSLGAVELAMLCYLLWNIQSALLPHEYPALLSIVEGELSLYRYVLVSTVIPFTMYLVSRVLFAQASALRIMLRAILVFSAYSAVVSVLEFTGPKALIWPRYIVDAPNWPGRANGVFNQPGVNGVVMITGFAIAVMLALEEGTARWLRWLYAAGAAGCCAGIYLTHTRAIYLGFVIVVVLGMIFAKPGRGWFAAIAGAMVAGVALNWSEFTSSDRSAGGIASTNEIYDRLNGAATSIWAFWEKPWAGWGLGRFAVLNFYHHQQWSPETPWIRGLGVASHFNELGILAELGIIGLVLWLAVLALLAGRLAAGLRTLPANGITGRPIVLIAMMAFVALIILGAFSDLRLFDYPTAMVFGLVGMAAGATDRFRAGQGVPPGKPPGTDHTDSEATRVPAWCGHAEPRPLTGAVLLKGRTVD